MFIVARRIMLPSSVGAAFARGRMSLPWSWSFHYSAKL